MGPAPRPAETYLASLRARLALAALTLAPCLGALELFFRRQEAGIVFLWDQPGRGYGTAPLTHDTNSLGFHEREIPPGPDLAVRRVVVLGDSVTWGVGPLNQTWTTVAEHALGPPWQILNFSTFGYDTEACAATLRLVASRWAPDLVVYASYTNDLNRSTVIQVGQLGYPIWIGTQPGGLPLSLRRRSALLRSIDGIWRSRGLHPQPDPAFYRAHVADMAAQARELGADFLVFGLVPHVFAGEACEASAEDCAWHRAAIEAQQAQVEALGSRWIPAEPMLDATGKESFFPDDAPTDIDHPDAEGRRVLGMGFAAALLDREGPTIYR